MADNVRLGTADPASELAASDDISGVQYQRIKLIHGADGVNDGDVSNINPFPAAEPLRKTADLTGAAINVSASGDSTLVAAVASQTTRVHRMWFVVGGATNITIKRGATALTGAIPFNAGGSFVLDLSQRPHFITGTNEAFVIGSSAAVQISGRFEYVTSA